MLPVRLVCMASSLAALVWIAPAAAQPAPTRRATTIEAVKTYPGFFHAQNVTIHGEVIERGRDVFLTVEGASLRVVGRERPSPGPTELRAVLYDIGRMNDEDPRVTALDLRTDIERLYGDRWPKPGEEIVLQATASSRLTVAPVSATPVIREIALDPAKYDQAQVTVTGQFRGRNLFADLPDSPTSTREDFVLRSGDAAIWVTGVRPRGRDFNFDPSRRVDTGGWVRVTGSVRQGKGLVWIEGTRIALAEPPQEETDETAATPLPPPPLDIVFSSPSPGEPDVRPTVAIRIQFSRDLDVASLKGRLRITYGEAQKVADPAEPPPGPVAFDVQWSPVNRGLEIRPAEPFLPFREVLVEFLDGVRGPDGALLKPVTLRFLTGG